MRPNSWQNGTMQELLERTQAQLANTSQNEEVVLLERKVDADTVADYATNQMIGRLSFRQNTAEQSHRGGWPMSLTCLVLQKIDRTDPTFRPAQARLPHNPLSQPHLFNPLSVEISMDNLNREPQLSTPIDTCILRLGIGLKDEAVLAWMRDNQVNHTRRKCIIPRRCSLKNRPFQAKSSCKKRR